jgi:hypothetical protein
MMLVDESAVLTRANAAPGFGPEQADFWRHCTLLRG